MAEHVVVETNWVIDYVAPALAPGPAARDLLVRARAGDLTLHVPALCLGEGRKVLRERTVRDYSDALRSFIRSRRAAGRMVPEMAASTFEVVSAFESFLETERREAPARIDALLREPAIDVFPLNDAMLARSVAIAASSSLELQSFDLAILAAVLEAAAPLRRAAHAVSFCTLDGHLQPWNKKGAAKPELQKLYDDAEVWVFGDFLFDLTARPNPWP